MELRASFTSNGDTEGPATATAVVVSQSTPQVPKTVEIAQNDTFFVYGLPPGDYKVFAFDRVEGLEYSNPEVLREYSSRAAEISLQSDEDATVKVKPIQIGG